MGCARVLALVAGLILLLPGMCFLVVGRGTRSGSYDDIGAIDIGVVILLVAALMFWVAFAKSGRPPDA